MSARAAVALWLLLALATAARAEDQVITLKDGRQYVVTSLARRQGKVRFVRKSDGKAYEVPESQVASPALDAIPAEAPPAVRPGSPPGETQADQVVTLKDGRKYVVTGLERRQGKVRFVRKSDGRPYEVPEDQAVSPALAAIPGPPRPVAVPAPTPAPVPAMPAPVVPAPPRAPPAPPPAPPLTAATRAEGFVPYGDRWDILDKLPADPRLVRGSPANPYNQNTLKGDKPIAGDSLFLVLTGTLEAPLEARRLPAASGPSAVDPGSLEFFGRGEQLFTSPRGLLSIELFQGQTAFKPKSWALKATAGFNLSYLRVQENGAVSIDVREGASRRRQDVSLEEGYGELKLATLSRQYDFVSLRAGIQPFVSDFRGFLFADSNLGGRLFGNADSNRWQYNVAWFDLLEKDTNSELNTFEKREQKVLVANLYRQDFLTPGFQVSLSYHRSQDNASTHYDANGFLVRPARIGTPGPHEITANYLGLAGDGHLGRLNLSGAYYYAFGTDTDHPLADRAQDVRAQMAALELSLDHDWLRFKGSFFWASGDDTPTDGQATGFDAIEDAPNFAGGPFSFWNRSAIALTQTGVLLKAPGSLLPSLRSSKFEGQANFVNPGLLLLGAGLDAELTPKLKAVLVGNYLRFDQTGALSLLLFQPGIRKNIGLDLGAGVQWRPDLSENVVITAGVSGLLPGAGFEGIYSSTCAVAGCGAESRTLYNAFVQIKLTY